MERGLDYTGILINTICHDGAGRFLFTRKSQDPGAKWGFGTTPLNFEEDPEEACARLVKTDCSVIASIERFLGVTSMRRMKNNRTSHWLVLSYLVRIPNPGEVPQCSPSDPNIELSWRFLSNPPDHLHDGTKTILQRYQRHLPMAGIPHAEPPKTFHGTHHS